MKKKFPLSVLAVFAIVAAAGWLIFNLSAASNARSLSALSTTTVLYDGSLGTLPDAQIFEYETVGVPSSQVTRSHSSGAATLDTTAQIGDYAGYAITPTLAPTLDRTTGFRLNFTVAVDAEAHVDSNRSGFSVILLAEDKKGIQIDFWEDEVWAQEGGTTDLFTKAEGVSFDTTSGLIAYELEIVGDIYTLSAPGMTTLTGAVRDYTAWNPPFPGAPDPYETPNLIFFGDLSSDGQSLTRWSYAAVTQDTAVPTNTPTATATQTAVSTNTPTATATQTAVSTNTPTATATSISNEVPTATPTRTPEYLIMLPMVTKP